MRMKTILSALVLTGFIALASGFIDGSKSVEGWAWIIALLSAVFAGIIVVLEIQKGKEKKKNKDEISIPKG